MGLKIGTQGNYPILCALSAGLLNRKVADSDLWLTILEEHVLRRDDPRIWQALAYSAPHRLDGVDRCRAETLLATLLERVPELLDVEQGLVLIDHHQRWLTATVSQRWLEALRSRGTRWHAQAFGELLVLRAHRLHSDPWAMHEIELLVEAPETSEETVLASRHSVAFMAALALRQGVLLDLAGSWLVRLAESEQPAISAAIQDAFPNEDAPPYDSHVDRLLAVLEAHPYHLQQDRISGLMHALATYAARVPERVIRLAAAVMETFGPDPAEMRRKAVRYGSNLLDLALTLQDIPGHVAAGLDLFERLQDLGLTDVEAVLNEREAHPGGLRTPRRQPRPACP